MNGKLQVICLGIAAKLRRGENLDKILNTYKALTEEEKTIIRKEFVK